VRQSSATGLSDLWQGVKFSHVVDDDDVAVFTIEPAVDLAAVLNSLRGLWLAPSIKQAKDQRRLSDGSA
jgi:hypothetical protein